MNVLKKITFYRTYRDRLEWYKNVIKNNPELNSSPSLEGERKWLEKWRKWVPNVKPMAYRVFSHYLGSDMNIVPYEVTDVIVEPILNPREYCEFYNDKNSLGFLFPQDMYQKAYLRRINGNYYDPLVATGGANLYLTMKRKRLSKA